MSSSVERTNPMVTPNKAGFTKKEYGGSASTLCTGCGHDSITMHVISAFYELDIPPHQVAKFSGIGCSSKTPAYFLAGSHGFNAVHGRMPSVATGAHVVRPDMVNIAVSGDGDTASIGVGQFAHIIRRNVRMLYIIENNGVYGLTKGQFSATADRASILKRGTRNEHEPIDLCLMALSLGCDFVARSFSGDVKQVVPLIKAGLSHRGLAVLDIISPCITFNNHEGSTKSYKYVRDNEQYLHEVGFVHGAQEIQVDYAEGETKVVDMHDGSKITLKKLDRDYDATNRETAMQVVEKARRENQFLTGLIYVNPKSASYAETLDMVDKPLAQLSQNEAQPSAEDLKEIMQALM